jgi:dynein heavy chain
MPPYQLDAHVEFVSEEEVMKLRRHYNHFMYQVRGQRGRKGENGYMSKI